jgi:hypothetical protein
MFQVPDKSRVFASTEMAHDSTKTRAYQCRNSMTNATNQQLITVTTHPTPIFIKKNSASLKLQPPHPTNLKKEKGFFSFPSF